MFSRRTLFAHGAGAALLLAGAKDLKAQAVTPYGIEDFFRKSSVTDVALSPNGTHISILRNETVDGARLALLDIVDAADPAKLINRIRLGEHEADYAEWASEERLLVWLTFDVSPREEPKSMYIRRVIAVKADGTGAVPLFGNQWKAMSYVFDLGTIVDMMPGDPDHVLMMAFDAGRSRQTLYTVSLLTGEAVVLEYGEFSTYRWYTQGGTPMIRLDAERKGTVAKVMVRAPGEDGWKLARKIRQDQTPDCFIICPTEEVGVFMVGARLEGEDTISVRKLDLKTLAFGPPLSSVAGADAVAGWVDERGRFMGTVYARDRRSYDFVDKAFAPHYRSLNKYFADEANVDLMDVDAGQGRYLAAVHGPRNPGSFILYDKTARSIVELGQRRPDLAPERLGKTEILKVKTRDGGEITAYLTAPPGGAPGPVVVMPHGGPEVRDTYDWDRQVQILAAQGWWVLQPNFRGSGGYGLEFAKAGWGRWGERMQEDVEDALAAAIDVRGLDSERVAIAGASYGGYAALMGAVRRPQLYKAVVCSSGVSDLPAMLAWEKSEDDTPDDERYAFWKKRIGDPEKDKAALEAASPRLRVAEIKAPVLLIHGVDDHIVPVEQARIMAKALKGAGKTYELIEVKREGHGGWPESKEQELMTKWVSFISAAFKAV